jgi:hypothetical protein
LVGLAETLSFCYHEEPDICSIFITIFATALERSVDLSSICSFARVPGLTDLMKDSRSNSAAGPIGIENCPPSEINEKCQMLLNVFNTRRTLLPLLKAAIDNEVQSTSMCRYVPLPTVSLNESPGPHNLVLPSPWPPAPSFVPRLLDLARLTPAMTLGFRFPSLVSASKQNGASPHRSMSTLRKAIAKIPKTPSLPKHPSNVSLATTPSVQSLHEVIDHGDNNISLPWNINVRFAFP